MYLANNDYHKPVVEGDKVTVPHTTRGRVYIAKYDAGGERMEPDMYYSPNLLGGSLEYDVDLSNAGCSCNAAVYLVYMPGRDVDGNPEPSLSNDFYCDANLVGGTYCPEMDIMEANLYSWHTTAHRCNAPDEKGSYYWCDNGGDCLLTTHSIDPKGYGPSDDYTINTRKMFHTKISFENEDNRLSAITVTLSQGEKEFSFSAKDEQCWGYGYLDDMKGPIENGMTIAMMNWGSNWDSMSWLDRDTCTGDCQNKPDMYISNISVTTGTKSVLY